MPVHKWSANENIVYILNGVLFSHKEGWNPVICRKIYGTGEHFLKQNKPDTKKKVSHVFSDM
jgi:hypothetical protein